MNTERGKHIPKSVSIDFEPLVDIDTICDRLKIPKKTIYKWCYEYVITGFPHIKIGRHLRFRFSEVDLWLKTYKCSPARVNKLNTIYTKKTK
jgi:excisionase family DNA binding protein